MRFRDSARLDASQVSDRRGMRPAGMAVGGVGGIGGLVILLIVMFSGGGGGNDASQVLQALQGMTVNSGAPNDLADECRTGADANEREDCRIVAVVNSVQSYWSTHLANYENAPTVFFSGSTVTGCGNATSAVGPFYCPADSTVYIDLGFYDELRERFGATGGPLAEAYVIAHEYGHHVSDLTGALATSRDGRTGPSSGSVRAELQADCYAGAWAAGAVDTGLIEQLGEADIRDALNAASVIGDDRIQQSQGSGHIDTETWTHGSSEQRQRWFSTGYDRRDPAACDTFAVAVP